MKRILVVVAVLALLCSALAAQAATELVGGFNDSWDGWSTPAYGLLTASALNLTPTEGSKFAVSKPTVMWSPQYIEKTFTLTGRSVVSFDIAYSTVLDEYGCPQASYAFEYLAATGAHKFPTDIAEFSLVGASNGWQHVSYEVQSGRGPLVVRFWNSKNTADINWLAVDNVKLSAVPEPSSIIVLVGGLGTLLALRRRRA